MSCGGLLITSMFEWYAPGRLSIHEVTRMARQAGLVFRRTRNDVPTATVHRILHNPLYTGAIRWDGRVYEGTHTPLVSRDLWDRVQASLTKRHGDRTRKAVHDFAYSGLSRPPAPKAAPRTSHTVCVGLSDV
jgi:site-specific DNA recombinase